MESALRAAPAASDRDDIDAASRRPRVCVFAPVPPPFIGSSYAVQLLLQSRAASSIEFIHVDTRYADEVADLGRPALRKLWRLGWNVVRLLRTCWRDKPSVVIIVPAFSRWAFLKDAIGAAIVYWMTSAQYVLWTNSNDGLAFYRTSNLLLRWLIRATLRRAARIVVVGESLRYNFTPMVQSDRIAVVPNGLPTEPSNTKERSRTGELRVLYLSNMMRPKGWALLLDAAREVCEVRSGVSFRFVGAESADSPRKTIEAAFAATRFPDRIRYDGPLYGPDKERALREADVLCLPTTYPTEALPLSILEAMRSGLPVITTDVGAISEAVVHGAGGFVLRNVDVASLRDAIIRLADDAPLLQSMGRFNRERFATQFSMDVVANRWTTLFTELEAERA